MTPANVPKARIAELTAIPEIADLIAGTYWQTPTAKAPCPDLGAPTELPCTGVGLEVFFAPDQKHGGWWSSQPAKAICAPCPSRGLCLAYAVPISNLHGVWGGSTREERAALRRVWRARSKGRTP